MSLSFILLNTAEGLRELFGPALLFYLFRDQLRCSPKWIALYYVCFFIAQLLFFSSLGHLPSVRELYIIGAMRLLSATFFINIGWGKFLFAASFLVYSQILEKNIANVIATYFHIMPTPDQTASIMCILITLGTFYPIFWLIRTYGSYLVNYSSPKLFTMANLITYSFIFSIATQQRIGVDFQLHHFIARILIMLPGLLFLGVIVYLIMEIERNKQLNDNINNLMHLHETEQAYYHRFLNNRLEAKKSKDKLKQDIDTMLQLLDAKDYAALQNYFNNLLAQSEKMIRLNLCGHQVIDAVIGYWQITATSHNVEFNADINIKEIHIDDLELALILGNILENAMTATTMPDVETSFINIQLQAKYNYLLIIVKNSFDGKIIMEDNTLLSAKRNFKKPGTGIRNIQFLVEKNKGYCKFIPQNNLFITQIALNNIKEADHD